MNAQSLPAEWIAHDKKIKSYQWQHRLLSWSKTAVGLAGFLALFISGKLLEWEWQLNVVTVQPFLQWLVYFGVLGLLWEVVSIPFGLLHHRVERSHQLSKQSYASWFKDRMKGWILGGILGTLTLFILYLCIRYFPSYWWAMACTALVLLSIVIAQLAPVVLIPLFFKLNPMAEGELKTRLLDLCKKFKIDVKDVYHLGLGEKTEKGNAAFVGIGRTKRIIIGDTLYQKFSAEEVEAVFAHELGHQVHHDLWKGIFVSSILMYATFFLANYALDHFLFESLDTALIRPFGLLCFFVALTLIQLPTGVIQAIFSRSCEWAADNFAAKTIGMGGKLSDALERLTFQNRGQFKPNALWEFLTYSHPAPWRRITALR